MSLRRSWLVLICVALGGVAGCGSAPTEALPPAAEPPRAPAQTTTAEGIVTKVGKRPEGIVADPRTGLVAVALRRPARLVLVDGDSGKVVRRLALPGAPRHLALAGPGGPVLVPAEDADRLDQISLGGPVTSGDDGRTRRARVIAAAKVGRQPHDATGLPDGRVAVGAELGNELEIVDGDRVVARTKVALQPGGLATLDHGRTIAVVSVRERVLELYDARTLKRLASEPAGVGPTHIVCRDEVLCYVADTTGKSVLIFEWRDGELQLTRRQPLPSQPYGIALDAERKRLWVTLPALNQVMELSAYFGSRQIQAYPAVQQPQTVAVDERTGHVFVTGATNGELQRLRSRTAPRRSPRTAGTARR